MVRTRPWPVAAASLTAPSRPYPGKCQAGRGSPPYGKVGQRVSGTSPPGWGETAGVALRCVTAFPVAQPSVPSIVHVGISDRRRFGCRTARSTTVAVLTLLRNTADTYTSINLVRLGRTPMLRFAVFHGASSALADKASHVSRETPAGAVRRLTKKESHFGRHPVFRHRRH